MSVMSSIGMMEQETKGVLLSLIPTLSTTPTLSLTLRNPPIPIPVPNPIPLNITNPPIPLNMGGMGGMGNGNMGGIGGMGGMGGMMERSKAKGVPFVFINFICGWYRHKWHG